jgi:redox-sensitive bicupin YhaK (pirin superfamily)
MIRVRRSDERGHLDHGWLDTYHSFSFGDYHDPAHMGFRSLRVLNEDYVAGGTGFGKHGHRDMEILTLVLEGQLRHQDSMGHTSVIGPGRVQRMSAGTGVLHSEVNASSTEPVHLLQIWILPDRNGYAPSYEERPYEVEETRGKWLLVASNDGRDGSVTIHQDASLWLTTLEAGESLTYPLVANRHAWLQVARGDVTVNGQSLKAGDAVAISGEAGLGVKAGERAELLLFDLA